MTLFHEKNLMRMQFLGSAKKNPFASQTSYNHS